LTEENKRAAREQLDIVLGLYPELGDGEGVRNVEDLLGEQEVMSRHESITITRSQFIYFS
jgi:hypothetical protein